MTPSVDAASARAAPRLRPLGQSDLDACLGIYYEATEALRASLGQPAYPRNPAPLRLLFEHLISTGPEWAWGAETDGALIAFAIASRRGDVWFLGFLFVRPEWQARGVGHSLLERCLPPPDERARIGTAAEADQPVSTGLYAAFGMAPRLPVYTVSGYLREGAWQPDDTLRATSFEEIVAAPRGHQRLSDDVARIDRAVLGYERPSEHRYLRLAERVGLAFNTEDPDEVIGYGYVAKSGRLGPVAMLDPGQVLPALAHLTRRMEPVGAWLAYIPGTAAAVLQSAIGAGLRIDGAPGIVCTSWPGPAFDRYLPLNLALL